MEDTSFPAINREALKVVQIEAHKPFSYIVSGSGQKGLPDYFKVLATVPLKEVSDYHTTVTGHAGLLSLCEKDGIPFYLQQGRVHFYETGNMRPVVLPILLARELGARHILLLNASGAVNPSLNTGDVMLIRDHINFMGPNILTGVRNSPAADYFVPLRPCYDPGFLQYMESASSECRYGIYAAVAGPAYETEAELHMMERLGIDAVGMSTVQEAIFARALKMPVSAASLITNDRRNTPRHEEVLDKAQLYLPRLVGVVKRFLTYTKKTYFI
jgi:purine-nucleoside phosphorylase